MKYYAGCNYSINQGTVPEEPLGTALSMHDCDGCEKFDKCKLKKTSELWEYNNDIKKQMDFDWAEMVGFTGWEKIKTQ